MTKLIIPFFLTMLVMAACSQEPVDYEQLTVAEVQKLAEQGDPGAQVNLGNKYYLGQDVPQDHEEAVRWYRLAAEQGDPDGQERLGVMYATGRGVPEDHAEAARWYRMAAEQGNVNSQWDLGFMYENGPGVPQDYAESVKWYRMAAEQGHGPSQFKLGISYETGRGIPQDYVQAHKWYNLNIARSTPNGGRHSTVFRDGVEEKMTREQIAEAQRLATAWEPKEWEVIRKELKIGPAE